jgi:hypothetical protein
VKGYLPQQLSKLDDIGLNFGTEVEAVVALYRDVYKDHFSFLLLHHARYVM